MVLQNGGVPSQNLGMMILSRRDLRHGVSHLSEHSSEALLLSANLGSLGARFRKLVENALALLSQKPEIDAFVSHGAIMPSR
jgi:hypothetical protein